MLTEKAEKKFPCRYLGDITYWDKKFRGVSESMQPSVIRHNHLEKGRLARLADESGNIALLFSNGDVMHSSSEKAEKLASEGEIVYIPWGGTPAVHYFRGKFVSGENRIAHVRDSSLISTRYLYYALLARIDRISECYRGGSLAHPDMNMMLHIEIPIPPLAVQKKIVESLDAFASLADELEKEISLRKKQFEICRSRLFSFDERNPLYDMVKEDVKKTELKKAAKIINGKDRRVPEDYGHLPVYGSGGVISHDGGCLSSGPAVIIPRKGSISNLFYSKGPCFCINTVFCIEPDSSILPKYMFYMLQDMHLERFNTSGNVPTLTKKTVQSLLISVPSMEAQKKTAEILDTLSPETSCAAIEKEIKERKKQFDILLHAMIGADA